MRLVMLFLLMSIAVQANAQSIIDGSGDAISETARIKIVADLSNYLSDPVSAQLRKLHVSNENDIVCGEVNAKNQFGGYVGFRPFFVDLSGKLKPMVSGSENKGMASAQQTILSGLGCL